MGNLALTGAPPALAAPLGVAWPVFGDDEQALLQGVLQSGIWWRGGHADQDESQVGRFERDFAAFQNAKYGIAVANGTVALEAALRAVGVEAGDEVIVPAVTFVATATAVLQAKRHSHLRGLRSAQLHHRPARRRSRHYVQDPRRHAG